MVGGTSTVHQLPTFSCKSGHLSPDWSLRVSKQSIVPFHRSTEAHPWDGAKKPLDAVKLMLDQLALVVILQMAVSIAASEQLGAQAVGEANFIVVFYGNHSLVSVTDL